MMAVSLSTEAVVVTDWNLHRTSISLWGSRKLLPVIVTGVPPRKDPTVGTILLTTGSLMYKKLAAAAAESEYCWLFKLTNSLSCSRSPPLAATATNPWATGNARG